MKNFLMMIFFTRKVIFFKLTIKLLFVISNPDDTPYRYLCQEKRRKKVLVQKRRSIHRSWSDFRYIICNEQ